MTLSKENNYNYDMPMPPMKTEKTDSSYSVKGMPTPPAGYGKSVGLVPAKAPDTCA